MYEEREPIAEGNGALGVERYAEVLAHTVYFGVSSKPEILQRLGVDQAGWAAAETKWMQVLVDEALQDEHPVTAAFAASFAPVLRRLKLEEPPLASVGSLSDASSPAQEAARATVDRPGVALLRSEIGNVRPTALTQTVNGPSAEPARSFETAGGLSGTDEINVEMFRDALPFVNRPVPPVFEAATNDETTEPRKSAVLPSSIQRDEGLSATGEVDISMFRGVLPFMDRMRAASPPSEPAEVAPAVELPELSVNQYASLCVELRRAPSEAAATLARYRLALEQRARLDALWQLRFASDSQLRSVFDTAVDVYDAWLTQAGR